jgi:hypothetical protein
MAIQGVISYTSADEEHFQITLPKPAGNTITLTDFWDQTANIWDNVLTARKQMHDVVRLQPTDCILGEEAATAFVNNSSVAKFLDMRNVTFGQLDLTNPIISAGVQMGAMFLGTIAGVRFWAYHPTLDVNGTDTALIRSKYAEFVHRGPAAEFKTYYGAIDDLDALDQRRLAARRFVKSRISWDPSELEMLVNSRPLPWPRRPGAIVSMKVVSG